MQDESVAEGLAIEVRRCDVAVPAEIESAFQAATGLFAARTFSPQLPVDQVFQRFGQAHPLGRIGTPEEVANLAAFLASSNASFCTGADYLIDEGLLAGLAVR
ncbi:MAG: SDR family oxidoreductase [Acidobacteriaceae bacterium]|nr:SDR family oxidoreductase [Acidobacteriaceae bacterium]MBV8569333.1 SDR family oxidoreductase [Acidobacteriaceae bacterium]